MKYERNKINASAADRILYRETFIFLFLSYALATKIKHYSRKRIIYV